MDTNTTHIERLGTFTNWDIAIALGERAMSDPADLKDNMVIRGIVELVQNELMDSFSRDTFAFAAYKAMQDNKLFGWNYTLFIPDEHGRSFLAVELGAPEVVVYKYGLELNSRRAQFRTDRLAAVQHGDFDSRMTRAGLLYQLCKSEYLNGKGERVTSFLAPEYTNPFHPDTIAFVERVLERKVWYFRDADSFMAERDFPVQPFGPLDFFGDDDSEDGFHLHIPANALNGLWDGAFTTLEVIRVAPGEWVVNDYTCALSKTVMKDYAQAVKEGHAPLPTKGLDYVTYVMQWAFEHGNCCDLLHSATIRSGVDGFYKVGDIVTTRLIDAVYLWAEIRPLPADVFTPSLKLDTDYLDE